MVQRSDGPWHCWIAILAINQVLFTWIVADDELMLLNRVGSQRSKSVRTENIRLTKKNAITFLSRGQKWAQVDLAFISLPVLRNALPN